MAYEQWQQTPEGIGKMFNADVANGGGSIAATPSLMQLLGQQQHADMLTGQDQARQLAYNQEADPQRLRQLQLGNDTTEAALPGVKAVSGLKQNELTVDNATLDDHIAAVHAEHGAKKTGAWAKEMNDAGSLIQAEAAKVLANPMGAGQRARALMTQLNIPANANLEQMGPEDLYTHLKQLGGYMMDASSKARQAIQKYEMTGNTQRDVQELKNEGNEAVAKIKKAAIDFASSVKLEGIRTPRGWDDYGAKMENYGRQLEQAGEMDMARQFYKEAYRAFQIKNQLAQSGAQTNTGKSVDIDALGRGDGLKSRGSQPSAVPPPEGPANYSLGGRAPVRAAPAASAASSAKPGSKVVRTGTVNGRKVEQLEDGTVRYAD